MLSPRLLVYPGVVFSSSPSFQTHLHSTRTSSPFIIHQQIHCKHHFCCLSYFSDSPTCYFPIRVNKSEKPSSLLHLASIHYAAFLPPSSPPLSPSSSSSTVCVLYLLTSLLILNLNSSFLLVLHLTLHPSPAGSRLPISTSALERPLVAELVFTFTLTCDIVCRCVLFPKVFFFFSRG